MRISSLIDKDGNFLNGQIDLIQESPINGNAQYSLFFNQVTLEFYNGIITLENGLIIPDVSSVVTSGLTGTITISVKSSVHSPYTVTLPGNGIMDISNTCVLQWSGITETLEVVTNSIVGADYINILIDRSN